MILLITGANVEACDKEGLTALGWSALKGRIFQYWILSQTYIIWLIYNHSGGNGYGWFNDPINMWIVFLGHMHCAKSLIEHRSNIHHLDRNGRAPLDLAAFKGDAQVYFSLSLVKCKFVTAWLLRFIKCHRVKDCLCLIRVLLLNVPHYF